jgi:NAD(P)-dependent dehydrogenase (short-subunit alcohol dehydrogenase family)
MSNALVTGAGRGIGRAIAAALVKEGHDVVVADIVGELAERTAREIGAWHARIDVADPDSIAEAAQGFDTLDVLVNNAGIVRRGRFPEVTVDDYQAVMDVNVRGPLLVTQAFTPALARGSGRAVIITASMSAYVSTPGTGIYPVSKTAVVALTRSLAVDLAPRGIRVNAVAPGRIITEMTADRRQDPEVERRTDELIPLGRSGQPDDIADVVVFLASTQSRYITGQTLTVDGGLTLGTIPYFQRAQQGL